MLFVNRGAFWLRVFAKKRPVEPDPDNADEGSAMELAVFLPLRIADPVPDINADHFLNL